MTDERFGIHKPTGARVVAVGVLTPDKIESYREDGETIMAHPPVADDEWLVRWGRYIAALEDDAVWAYVTPWDVVGGAFAPGLNPVNTSEIEWESDDSD